MRHRIARLFALLLRRDRAPRYADGPTVLLGIGMGSCGMPSKVVRGAK
ncbi:hypothetical protein [Streptomyces cyaneus]|nr:hypothetical protein [Streptomyces cyaneus]